MDDALGAAVEELLRDYPYNFCDFPTGFAIQALGEVHGLSHHPRCSTPAGFLCDCDAILDVWRRGMDSLGKERRY